MGNVPFFNLSEQTKGIRAEVDAAISGVIDNTSFVLGPALEQFEKDFSGYCGTKFCAGTSSGTSALVLALLAYKIGSGDEVITVANTFIATVEAIAIVGATPVLVDVFKDNALMDHTKLEDAITENTKAIIPVHLFGQCCDMDPIMEIARKHGLKVIEDSCQAHGAMYKGKRAGSLGDAGAFSFYPSKNLGSFGEGGAVTTDDEEVLKRIKGLRHHGQIVKNEHSELGHNYRLHSLQAAVLGVKLKYLDGWNEKRRSLAERYHRNLEGTGFWMASEHKECKPVYHLFALGCAEKEAVGKALTDAGIGWGQHYPVPIHLQPAFRHLGLSEGDFPVSEKLMRTSITLPMYPELEPGKVDQVCDVLKAAVGK
ncbi:MAG: DegT/DnrJ/EryC1/StrS family aminotransferase [Candidatus Krumholzibacteriota bacterium]|nr:DegT/DnrJ/EryC1/StrS family aminotransferase [Candidatus Krumholzibacteriota bacterium]